MTILRTQMSLALGAFMFSVSAATAQPFVDGTEASLPSEVREGIVRSVTEYFIDARSAQFRNLRLIKIGLGQIPIVCGQVNAKNPYGRYVGFRDFFFRPDNGTSSIRNEVDEFSSSLSEKRRAEAYLIFCDAGSQIAPYIEPAQKASWVPNDSFTQSYTGSLTVTGTRLTFNNHVDIPIDLFHQSSAGVWGDFATEARIYKLSLTRDVVVFHEKRFCNGVIPTFVAVSTPNASELELHFFTGVNPPNGLDRGCASFRYAKSR